MKIGDRQGFVPVAYVQKLDSSLTASQSNLSECTISLQQRQIESQYGNLMDQERLEESCKVYQLVRDAGKLAQRIADKVFPVLFHIFNSNMNYLFGVNYTYTHWHHCCLVL